MESSKTTDAIGVKSAPAIGALLYPRNASSEDLLRSMCDAVDSDVHLSPTSNSSLSPVTPVWTSPPTSARPPAFARVPSAQATFVPHPPLPVSADGVALGIPCAPVAVTHRPAPPSGPVYGWAAAPPAAVFSKSSLMARQPLTESVPPTATASLTNVLRDVRAGRLSRLPLGLKLDCEAVVREMNGMAG